MDLRTLRWVKYIIQSQRTVSLDEVPIIVKLTEPKNRMVVAREWRERDWELLINLHKISVMHDV